LQLASGVEYPALFLIDATQYQPNPSQPFYLKIVVAHEAAHQWWYGVVGNNVLADPWQDEALATFSSLVYLQTYDPQVYQGTLGYYNQRVDELGKGAGDTGVSQPTLAFQKRPQYYSTVVYLKGALFIQAVRQRLGDSMFFEALQRYYTQDSYQIASPESLLSDFEKVCECSLEELYTQWGVK
jgi:aminopeptidase N